MAAISQNVRATLHGISYTAACPCCGTPYTQSGYGPFRMQQGCKHVTREGVYFASDNVARVRFVWDSAEEAPAK